MSMSHYLKKLEHVDKKYSDIELNKKDIFVKVIKTGNSYYEGIKNGVYKIVSYYGDRVNFQHPQWGYRYGSSIEILLSNGKLPTGLQLDLSSKDEYNDYWKIKIKRRGPIVKSKIIKKAKFNHKYSWGGTNVSTKEYYSKNDITFPMSHFDNLYKNIDDKNKVFLSTDVMLTKEVKSNLTLTNDINKATYVVLNYGLINAIYNCNNTYYFNATTSQYHEKPGKNYDIISDLNFHTKQVKYLKFLEGIINDTKYKLILDKDLTNNFGVDKSVIDKEMFISLSGMLDSSAEGDRKLAKSIIINSYYDQSKTYLLLLLNKYVRFLYDKEDFKSIHKYFGIPHKEFKKDWKIFVNYLVKNNIITNTKELTEYTEEQLAKEVSPYFTINKIDIKL